MRVKTASREIPQIRKGEGRFSAESMAKQAEKHRSGYKRQKRLSG